jgi:hypothetical protein
MGMQKSHFTKMIGMVLVLLSVIQAKELLTDRHFEYGLWALGTNADVKPVKGVKLTTDTYASEKPFWDLVEQHSRHTLATYIDEEGHRYNNYGGCGYGWKHFNEVILGKELDLNCSDATLSIDSWSQKVAYNSNARGGNWWPHLQIRHRYGYNEINLGDYLEVIFSFDAILRWYSETDRTDAQYPDNDGRLNRSDFVAFVLIHKKNAEKSVDPKYGKVWLGIRPVNTGGNHSYSNRDGLSGVDVWIPECKEDSELQYMCAYQDPRSFKFVPKESHYSMNIHKTMKKVLGVTESEMSDYFISEINIGWESYNYAKGSMGISNLSLEGVSVTDVEKSKCAVPTNFEKSGLKIDTLKAKPFLKHLQNRVVH